MYVCIFWPSASSLHFANLHVSTNSERIIVNSGILPRSQIMFANYVQRLRCGQPVEFPPGANTIAYARQLDQEDELSYLRDEFLLPSKDSLQKTKLDGSLPRKWKPFGHYT